MAKAKKQTKRDVSTLAAFVKRKPELTVLTDHPLGDPEIEKTFADDPFNFRYKLGPVFDILRHPDTQTPAAILISGGWGTGKTSGMKWLEYLLKKWNQEARQSDVRVRPVWFYPWKYDNKEDVRRGLIAEVIINAVYIRNPENKKITISSKKLLTGLKLLGSFGLNVVSDLAAASEYEIPVVPGLKISGQALNKIKEHYNQAAHPEAAFLNALEASMNHWVEESLGRDGRMVIFIDDLDRCMPEVALMVLESIKLFLNIRNLVFVAGVDKEVIQNLVVEHYRELGLVKEKHPEETEEEQRERRQAERKARQYLSKMFQVEIELALSQKQIADFLVRQVKDLTLWDEYLDEKGGKHPNYKDLFERLILKFARRNPRELKRQLNNALMAGIGIDMIDLKQDADKPRFEQGLQLYFIREVLKGYTLISDMIDIDLGRRFFKDWSDFAIECKDLPEEEKYPVSTIDREARDEVEYKQGISFSDKLAERDSTYEKEQYLQLLNDLDLRALVQIPFSTKLAEFTGLRPLIVTPEPADAVAVAEGVNVVIADKRHGSRDYIIVRDAVARQLNKNPDEVEPTDYKNVTKLDLSNSGISDLSSLLQLVDLQKLFLGRTLVSDINVLKNLTNLRWLSLRETQVSDIRNLAGLTMLTDLNLFGTYVDDVSVLSDLTNLQELSLARTQVSDISVLISLKNLQKLYLGGIQIDDIGVLSGLVNLQTLDLPDTKVSDISVLSDLTNLQVLSLSGTPVVDLSPLVSLTNMRWLDLSYVQISDVGFLANLTKLQRLWLRGTQVTDLGPLASLTNLERLWLSKMSIDNIEPLAGLINVQRLDLRDSQVVDIRPLASLLKLQALNLSGTPINDVSALASLTKLQEVDLRRTQVSKEQVAELQKALPNLKIVR